MEQPDAAGNFLDVLNPDSLSSAPGARIEPALRDAAPGHPLAVPPGGLLLRRPGRLPARRSGLEPDHDAQGHLDGPGGPGRGPAPGPPAEGARRAGAPREGAGATPGPSSGPPTPRWRPSTRGSPRSPGVSADQADLLSADVATAAWFDAAVAAGAPPGPVARWLLNELLGLAGDAPLASLPLPAADFGRFVALAESGRITGAGAKALLASLVERPGDPAARLAELGLEKVDDRAAVDGAVARVLAAQAAEVARYRAGEKKLLGFLLGAAMRETQGKADPAALRKALQEALG